MLRTTILLILTGWSAAALSDTFRIDPIYPEEAYKSCVEGFVVLRYTVVSDRRIVNVEVIESEPVGWFEEAAIAGLNHMVENEEVEPGVKPIETRITFELDDSVCQEGGGNGLRR